MLHYSSTAYSRPAGINVASWCICTGITKADYYRLRCVSEIYPKNIQTEMSVPLMVAIEPDLLKQN